VANKMLAFRDEQRKELEAHCHCGKQLVRRRAMHRRLSCTILHTRALDCNRRVGVGCLVLRCLQGDYTTINMTMLSAGDPTTSQYNVIPGIAVGG